MPDQSAEVVTRPPAVTVPAVTSHCCFFCQWCSSPILLAHDQMGLPFAHPSLRRIEVRSVASVCRSCNHVASYSLFRGCSGFDTRHKLMLAPTAGKTILLEWLQCDASSCPFRVPLFVNFDDDLSAEDAARFIAIMATDRVLRIPRRINEPGSATCPGFPQGLEADRHSLFAHLCQHGKKICNTEQLADAGADINQLQPAARRLG